jgi:archaellum component FlaC
MALSFEKEQTPEDVRIATSEMVRRLNEASRRVKAVEQRMDKIESDLETLEDTALGQMNDIKVNLERILTKIGDVSNRLNVLESDIVRINKDLGKAATKAEIKQIETFIDIVNPITSKFVTRDELERVFEEKLKKRV